ncbi:MAG: hypothetical protein ACR2MM_02745 [Flavobacteriaceae bacterium]
MKKIKLLLIGLIVVMATASCKNENNSNSNMLEIEGIIQKQGITTYQYGTHTISGYALRSSSVDLDNYIDQSVTVVGYIIDGYPVDGGPDFIEVESVK